MKLSLLPCKTFLTLSLYIYIYTHTRRSHYKSRRSNNKCSIPIRRYSRVVWLHRGNRCRKILCLDRVCAIWIFWGMTTAGDFPFFPLLSRETFLYFHRGKLVRRARARAIGNGKLYESDTRREWNARAKSWRALVIRIGNSTSRRAIKIHLKILAAVGFWLNCCSDAIMHAAVAELFREGNLFDLYTWCRMPRDAMSVYSYYTKGFVNLKTSYDAGFMIYEWI